jgi:hypothetical protein
LDFFDSIDPNRTLCDFYSIRGDDIPAHFDYDGATHLGANTARQMIRNGLYSISTKLLDGVDGGATGVSVLRNGTMLGGGTFLYHIGSY